jgi:hypothetical protein
MLCYNHRADIKMLIGLPPVTARYQILHSCVTELIRAGIITATTTTTTSSVGATSTNCSETEHQTLPTYDELSTDDIDSITRRIRAMATSSSTGNHNGSASISESYMNGSSGVQHEQVISIACYYTYTHMLYLAVLYIRQCFEHCTYCKVLSLANSFGINCNHIVNHSVS